MENFLNNSINSIKSLWLEFFCFKTFKKLPLWLAIVLFILELPLLIFTAVLSVMFFIYWGIAYLQNIPAMTLSKIIKSESQDIHFGAQIVIYFICYGFIFSFYLVSSLMMPLLFVLYFIIHSILSICSGDGVKFAPNLASNPEREIVDLGIASFFKNEEKDVKTPAKKIEVEFSLPVLIKTLVFVVLSVLVFVFNNIPSLSHSGFTTLFGLFNRNVFANLFVSLSLATNIASYFFDLFKAKKVSKILDFVAGGLMALAFGLSVWNFVQMIAEGHWKFTFLTIIALVVNLVLTVAIFVSAVLFEKVFKTKK